MARPITTRPTPVDGEKKERPKENKDNPEEGATSSTDPRPTTTFAAHDDFNIEKPVQDKARGEPTWRSWRTPKEVSWINMEDERERANEPR